MKVKDLRRIVDEIVDGAFANFKDPDHALTELEFEQIKVDGIMLPVDHIE